jgi:hypothetical protein
MGISSSGKINPHKDSQEVLNVADGTPLLLVLCSSFLMPQYIFAASVL